MTGTLEEMIVLLQTQLWHGFSIFLRVGALVSLLPGFGEQSVSVRIRLVIALAFTAIVAPAVPGPVFAPSPDGMVLLIFTEALAGLALGIGVRIFMLALQTAGTIAAQSTSLSQILGNAGVEPLPAIGYVLMIGAIALAVLTGLHIRAAELLVLSYDMMPIGVFTPAADLSAWGLDQVRRAFSLAFTLAAPFVLLSVLYNLALGAINKAMPQLMVAFVGAPVITFGGLALLFLTAPVMLTVWLEALEGFMADPFRPIP